MEQERADHDMKPGRDWPGDIAFVAGMAVIAAAFFLGLGTVAFTGVCVAEVVGWMAHYRVRWGEWWLPRR